MHERSKLNNAIKELKMRLGLELSPWKPPQQYKLSSAPSSSRGTGTKRALHMDDASEPKEAKSHVRAHICTRAYARTHMRTVGSW